MSGTHTERAGLQQLLADARARKFRKVIVSDRARLSRDATDCGLLRRKLEDSNVTILDASNGLEWDDPNAEIQDIVGNLADSQYVKAVSRNTHRGLKELAHTGHHTGGRAFGYASVVDPNSRDPKKPHYNTVVDADEAEAVVRIFTSFASGRSPREIAQVLNVEGLAAPHDGGKGHKGTKGWAHTTIRAMLRNRRYLGEVRWNAYQWKKRGENRKRRVRVASPESEHVITMRPELAIVSADL